MIFTWEEFNLESEKEFDFIGGETPLTADEEKALSEYFRKKESKLNSEIAAGKQRARGIAAHRRNLGVTEN